MERSGTLDKQVDLKKAQIFAEKLAIKAGDVLLDYVDKIRILKHKDRQDIATNADLASEGVIIEAIEKQYPDHGVLSEERGKIEKKSNYVWIIDPLDGTKEYVRGIPIYNVSFSLQKDGQTLLSVVLRPSDRQLFSARKDGGAFLNGKKIEVSRESNLADSFVYAYLPHPQKKAAGFEKAWQKLIKLSRLIYRLRTLADLNVSCCWVAMGGGEAFINLFNPPEPWDIIPGLFIAQEAGAKTCDISGRPILNNFESGILVSNGKIHKVLLEVLNES